MPGCTTADGMSSAPGPDEITAVEVFTTSDVPYLFAIGAEESSRTVNKRARASFGNPIGSARLPPRPWISATGWPSHC